MNSNTLDKRFVIGWLDDHDDEQLFEIADKVRAEGKTWTRGYPKLIKAMRENDASRIRSALADNYKTLLDSCIMQKYDKKHSHGRENK